MKDTCPFDNNIRCEQASECAKWLKERDCVVSVDYLEDWEKHRLGR
jgi:hypothetical protein